MTDNPDNPQAFPHDNPEQGGGSGHKDDAKATLQRVCGNLRNDGYLVPISVLTRAIEFLRPSEFGEYCSTPEPFQSRVKPWLTKCFGDEISNNKPERNHRFLEEALELVQACGCTDSEAHQLVDYVYGRDVGEKQQEVGGVMVTLAALCLAQNIDMHECGETELARVWTKVEKIRAKQAAKPKHSPLPQHPPTPPKETP